LVLRRPPRGGETEVAPRSWLSLGNRCLEAKKEEAMAILSVPIKFQIFKGSQWVREETLNESVIKIGKLASSHLRLDDDTVSRMHAVVEVVGPGKVELIDLGSTRGTMVNGARVDKATLSDGDQIHFGDSRVVVSFTSAVDLVEATPPLAIRGQEAASATPPGTEARQMATARVSLPRNPVPATTHTTSTVALSVGDIDAGGAPSDHSTAIEVQTHYRGILVNTRHLTDVTGKEGDRRAKAFMGVGVVLILMSLALFFSALVAAGRERTRFEAFTGHGGESRNFQWTRSSPAQDFMVFGGFAMGLCFVYMGLKRRREAAPNFTIGSASKADAPVGQEYVGAASFPLVRATGTGFLVNVTSKMSGEVHVDGRATLLPQLVQERGFSFPLGDRGFARIDCGATTFLARAMAKPPSLPVPFLTWRWTEQAYTVGTAASLLLFLLMIFSVPPDPKSLSLDHFSAQNQFLSFVVKPPVEKEEDMPDWLKKSGPEDQGGEGQRHKDDEGRMGNRTSKKKEGLVAIKGPKDNQDQHLAKKLAEESAKTAGILGVLRTAEGSHVASIFGRDTAVGSDTANVLGGLIGSEIGEAYGIHGLGLVGTGSGGGGTGEGTLGLARYGTMGKGGGGGEKSGYGRGMGGLTGRRARGPEIIVGQATVRGSLDKEIIRRIIRRHINEVKFCYETELTKNSNLAGRISVQFTIAGAGQVIASVMQSSTMGNVRVEGCVVQAVRRWEFPRPVGGGIVIVSYPFNFTSGNAGN
jgi:pSer/pThr/pTyr-binding forkhead associated (FHA) protein